MTETIGKGALQDLTKSGGEKNFVQIDRAGNITSTGDLNALALVFARPEKLSPNTAKEILEQILAAIPEKKDREDAVKAINDSIKIFNQVYQRDGNTSASQVQKKYENLIAGVNNDVLRGRATMSTNVRLEYSAELSENVIRTFVTDALSTYLGKVGAMTGAKSKLSQEQIRHGVDEILGFTQNRTKSFSTSNEFAFFPGAKRPYVGTFAECMKRALSHRAQIGCVSASVKALDEPTIEWAMRNAHLGQLDAIDADLGKITKKAVANVYGSPDSRTSARLSSSGDERERLLKTISSIGDQVGDRVFDKLDGSLHNGSCSESDPEDADRAHTIDEMRAHFHDVTIKHLEDKVHDLKSFKKTDGSTSDVLTELASDADGKPGGPTRAETLVQEAVDEVLVSKETEALAMESVGSFSLGVDGKKDFAAYLSGKPNPQSDPASLELYKNIHATYEANVARLRRDPQGKESISQYLGRIENSAIPGLTSELSKPFSKLVQDQVNCALNSKANSHNLLRTKLDAACGCFSDSGELLMPGGHRVLSSEISQVVRYLRIAGSADIQHFGRSCQDTVAWVLKKIPDEVSSHDANQPSFLKNPLYFIGKLIKDDASQKPSLLDCLSIGATQTFVDADQLQKSMSWIGLGGEMQQVMSPQNIYKVFQNPNMRMDDSILRNRLATIFQGEHPPGSSLSADLMSAIHDHARDRVMRAISSNEVTRVLTGSVLNEAQWALAAGVKQRDFGALASAGMGFPDSKNRLSQFQVSQLFQRAPQCMSLLAENFVAPIAVFVGTLVDNAIPTNPLTLVRPRAAAGDALPSNAPLSCSQQPAVGIPPPPKNFDSALKDAANRPRSGGVGLESQDPYVKNYDRWDTLMRSGLDFDPKVPAATNKTPMKFVEISNDQASSLLETRYGKNRQQIPNLSRQIALAAAHPLTVGLDQPLNEVLKFRRAALDLADSLKTLTPKDLEEREATCRTKRGVAAVTVIDAPELVVPAHAPSN